MTYEKMMDKINTAGTWFTGVFLGEILHKYPNYCNDTANKVAFIKYMHEEYGKNLDYSYDTTKTKCYAVIAIIEGRRVVDALEHVVQSNENKVPEDAKENANALLNAILTNKIQLP